MLLLWAMELQQQEQTLQLVLMLMQLVRITSLLVTIVKLLLIKKIELRHYCDW